QQVEEQLDGSVLFRLHIAVPPEFVNWLLYYGSRVEVLSPAFGESSPFGVICRLSRL
ncbi:MAG: WYL domain-containing protein, partial [Anaerolineae bacterium]|nr:WYL domain-containing protein [Anaerolineae bacterium]